MTKPALFGILIVAAATACPPYSQSRIAANTSAEGHSNEALLNHRMRASNRQSECSAKARQETRRLGWDAAPRARVRYNYNKRRRRCFLDLQMFIAGGNGNVDIERSIIDSTGREYATYLGVGRTGLSFEPAPELCEVLLGSGEVMECFSLDQFEQIAGSFMK